MWILIVINLMSSELIIFILLCLPAGILFLIIALINQITPYSSCVVIYATFGKLNYITLDDQKYNWCTVHLAPWIYWSDVIPNVYGVLDFVICCVVRHVLSLYIHESAAWSLYKSVHGNGLNPCQVIWS